MPIISFTPADMLQATTISEVGWFTFVVDDIKGPVESAKGGSQNYEMFASIVDHPKWTGKQIKTIFNTKMMGNAVPFLSAALLVKPEPGVSYDLDETKGKKFDGKLGTRPYDGRLINEITDYLPAGEGKNAPANPFE